VLNLYSLVKERLIAQAPPNAGESAVKKRQLADSFEFGLVLGSPRCRGRPELLQETGD
jgi:hypothetical protein